MRELKFDLNDVVLIPSEESHISSRKECKTTKDFYGQKLPLIASPMDTVVSMNNYKKYIDNYIIPCIPRGLAAEHLVGSSQFFQSFGLCEIEQQLTEFKSNITHGGVIWDIAAYGKFYNYPNILIDIANGHMSKLVDLVKQIKGYWPDINLMIGNVANPETFVNLGLAGADYVRCSVGTGAGCTTAANVSINYPLGSLISECYEKRSQYDIKTKIVADGGMRNYSDIIKALALGADYVMIGSIFNKAIESAGFNYLWKIKINNKMAELLWRYGFPVKKKYRGMSTKAVQRSWGKSNLVTAEGITKYQKVEYTLQQWTENFTDYLKSAMSYCNAKTLDDFIGKAEYIFITDASRRRFEK
jgi:GMP reductase